MVHYSVPPLHKDPFDAFPVRRRRRVCSAYKVMWESNNTAMQFRLWNSFNFLAVVLMAIGIIGAFSRGKMVFDPGRAPSGKEWIIYFVAGALMLVNGFLPPANPPETKPASDDTPPATTPE